ncbi:MAG TPA: hypothetical protein VHY37_02070 [Tepidisphaeraceae bacterium]|nr:hypothetical protein [Tepidisphaeraceae bacterium]
MSKRVALVGHCGPDSSYLRMAITSAARDVKVLMADDDQELQMVLEEGVDLLLFNRQLDFGFDQTEGVAIMRDLHHKHPNLKMMLISNYPDAQAAAQKAGAIPGFGKRDIGSPRVKELLRAALA